MKIIPTHIYLRPVFFLLVVVSTGYLISCTNDLNSKNRILFHAFVGGEPLQFGKEYPAPNEDGTYSIADFKMYVSNIKLLQNSDEPGSGFIEEESYHLISFPDGNQFSFNLQDVVVSDFDQIQISIGIDSFANHSTDNPGDLDPTNQMAWNWTSGYKFLLLEGIYKPSSSDRNIPLVFHIGFSENTRELAFELPNRQNIEFDIEINALFSSQNIIDFNTMPKILFNQELAALVATNYAKDFMVLK